MNGKAPKSHPASHGHGFSWFKCPSQPFPPGAEGLQELKLQRFAGQCQGLSAGECSWFIQKILGGFGAAERETPGKIECIHWL